MVAPVCHDSQDQKINQPAPKLTPAIPHAIDLPSALAAIQALTTTINYLMNPIIINNSGGSNMPAKPTRWSESPGTRVIEKVKITNPNDPTQFVEIERIKSLTMQDGKTGENWVWHR